MPLPRATGFGALLLLAAGCFQPQAAPPPPAPPKVVVAAPVTKEVADYADYTGRVEAPESVDVRARVNGYIVEIGFKEGSDVKKGDPLFVIDPRPYEEELKVATGQVEVAKARVQRTTNDLKRADEQRKTPGVISQQEYDKIFADKVEADAMQRAAEAQVGGKKLNVEFTRVVAPIAGRISKINLTVGNLVSADSSLLTRIVSQDPMYAYFDIDEATVLRIQAMIRAGTFRSARTNDDVPVRLGLASEPGQYPHAANINFVDNRINPGTGTVKVRAVLPNPLLSNDTRMFGPGLFVRVRVPLGSPRPVVLVADRCVVADQAQKFVYTVDDKNVCKPRLVTLGQIHDGLRVVDGIKAGDRVIVAGVQRVRPDAVVDPQPGEMIAAK